MSVTTDVKNNNLEFALKKFKNDTARSGVLSAVRDRKEYKKPGVKRREEKKKNIINSRKNSKKNKRNDYR